MPQKITDRGLEKYVDSKIMVERDGSFDKGVLYKSSLVKRFTVFGESEEIEEEGFFAGITGAAIGNIGTKNLFTVIAFILAIGVGITVLRVRRMRKKKE